MPGSDKATKDLPLVAAKDVDAAAASVPASVAGVTERLLMQELVAAGLAPLMAVLALPTTGLSAESVQRSLSTRIAGTPGNLYDPTIAVDGKVYNYAGGTPGTLTTSAITGLIPVREGFHYTLTMDPTEPQGMFPGVFVWNADRGFMGMDHLVTTNVVVPGINPAWTVLNHTVNFDVPAGSGIGFVSFNLFNPYTAHTTDQFDHIRHGISVVGYNNTADGFRHDGYNILPMTRYLRVTRSGKSLYIRSSWDASNDLVQRLYVSDPANASWPADPVNFIGARTVPKATTDAGLVTAYGTGTNLHDNGDDSTPFSYNAGYVGANHGPNFAVNVTVASHDKTVADIGSDWVDGSAHHWYLIKIVDATHLWFLSDNIGAADKWLFRTSVGASPLTHSAGATHTADVVFSAQALAEIRPYNQNRKAVALLDGVAPVRDDGTYYCTHLDIAETYDIPNLPGVLAYIRAGVGAWTAQPAFNDASVAADASVSLVYRYAFNGSCTVYQSFLARVALTLGYLGWVQAGALTHAGTNHLWAYVPKMNPVVGSLDTYDVKARVDITSLGEIINTLKAGWISATQPPDRFVQMVKDNGGAYLWGFVEGISEIGSGGVPATRGANCGNAGFINTTLKIYPHMVDGTGAGDPVAGQWYEAVGYRSYFCPAWDTAATLCTWVYDGGDVLLLLDYHQSLTNHRVPLPIEFAGRNVTVVEKTSSLTVLNSVAGADGITINVTGGYGSAALMLSRGAP